MISRFKNINYPFWLGLVLAFMGVITTSILFLSGKGFLSYYWINIASQVPLTLSLLLKIKLAELLLAELSDVHVMLITIVLTAILTVGYFSLAAHIYNRSKKRNWKIIVFVISTVLFVAIQFLGTFLGVITEMGGPSTDIDLENAVLSGDPQKCIDIDYKVNPCILRMAYENDDSNICLAIPSSKAKDSCITDFAVKHKDRTFCDAILNLEREEPLKGHKHNYYECLTSLGESTGNSALCEEIPEGAEKNMCSKRVQIALNQS